jgi:hypothetical protein
VADPDRKGKVESAVGHAQKTPLKGMRFESPQEAQVLAIPSDRPRPSPCYPPNRE